MNNSDNKAIQSIDSTTVFAPYFRARWQNMQNIINDSAFLDLVPETLKVYYQAYIKQWIEWSSGFVPMLHRGDFFSTGIGYTVCDIFTKECMSGGFRLDSTNKDLQKFIENWASGSINDILNQMFFYTNSGGNAILCLTPTISDLLLTVYPINRIVYEIGKSGAITQATILNRFASGKASYYARETRLMLNGKPFVKVLIAKQDSLETVPVWSKNGIKVVPSMISQQWFDSYGNMQPSKWYELPFDDLGLYNIKNKAVAVAMADVAGYSDSSLHTALDILYSIDFNYTQSQIDQYFGKSRILLPNEMRTRAVDVSSFANGESLNNKVVQGQSFQESVQPAPLMDTIYAKVIDNNSIDGKSIQPEFIQPDIRGEAHKFIRDADLELLASKVGLSSTTLANHLAYNSSKTATEVNAEQDTTETSVNNKRDLASVGINKMLKTVAKFFGYIDDVNIQWNRSCTNSKSENEELLRDFQAGTIPLKEYLKRRWRGLSDIEIDEWVEEIDKKANMFGGGFGGF